MINFDKAQKLKEIKVHGSYVEFYFDTDKVTITDTYNNRFDNIVYSDLSPLRELEKINYIVNLDRFYKGVRIKPIHGKGYIIKLMTVTDGFSYKIAINCYDQMLGTPSTELDLGVYQNDRFIDEIALDVDSDSDTSIIYEDTNSFAYFLRDTAKALFNLF